MAAQVALRAMSGVAKDISGEVGLVAILYGLRVGVSGLLSMMRLDSCWRMSSPRSSGVCVVSQVWSWALKSPRIYVLDSELRWFSWRRKCGGVDESGGM